MSAFVVTDFLSEIAYCKVFVLFVVHCQLAYRITDSYYTLPSSGKEKKDTQRTEHRQIDGREKR